MKKSYLKIMAAAASVLLFACCQENEIDIDGKVGVVGENAIAFSLGGPSTRSAVSISDVTEQGVTIPLGTDEMGSSFYLEESVIDLNSPVTRGTPVYTENVFKMYPKMYAHSALDDLATDGDIFTYDSETGYYTSVRYGTNIWDKGTAVGTGDNATKQLKFWMYMPYDLADADCITTAPTFGGETSGAQTITFGYQSPETAAEQQDILFSARAITESEYNANEKVADVLFHHALTGVKFRIENPDDGITITGVSFTGLYDKGTCVVTPTTEGDPGVYKDITTEYSSQKDGVVAWSSLGVTSDYTISATFGDDSPVTFAKPAEGKNGSFANNGEYPASFAATGNENNLNDGDATQTFWLIPQTIDEDVQLTITYKVSGSDKEIPWTVDFGAAYNGKTWKPGQLRTFTIKVDDVNVQIDDEVTGTGIVDMTKSDVAIKNTGNVDVFIRAAIVGQWLDKNDNPVFGFTDEVNNLYTVESWYQDQFENHSGQHGEFVNLAGYSNTAKSTSYANPYPSADNEAGCWYYCSKDRYYYFSKPVAPDAETGVPLFDSYTISKIPEATNAGVTLEAEMYFTLEIATQAISAKMLDGTNNTWKNAWKNALGYDPSATN